MIKHIVKVYFIIALIMLAGIIYITFNFKAIDYNARTDIECSEWTDFEVSEEYIEGIRYKIYSRLLDKVPNGKQYLFIWSVHQNTEVFIDDELIFMHAMTKDINPFGKTPGVRWDRIMLKEADEGKTIKIRVTSPYESNIDVVPKCYFGPKSDLYALIVKKEIVSIFIAFCTIFIGVVFLIYSIYFIKELSDRRILFLGIFAIFMGIWIANDLRSVNLIINEGIAGAYISFTSLMLMPISFLMFLKETFSLKKVFAWNFIMCVSLAHIILSNVLLITGVMDFKETVPITHFVFGFSALTAVFIAVDEIRRVGLSRRLKINILFIVLCVGATVISIVMYNLKSTIDYGLTASIAFLIYVIVLGIESIRETYAMLQKGRLAKKFEEMAYRDELTGMYNRFAMNELEREIPDNAEGWTVIMFDLNSLKRCNDDLGHEFGDIYIKTSADYISEIFGSEKCYRIGGDEFCVLVYEMSEDMLKECFDKLKEKEKEFNLSQNKIKMHIACGYALYDSSLDENIDATRSRADANMYKNKENIKKNVGV